MIVYHRQFLIEAMSSNLQRPLGADLEILERHNAQTSEYYQNIQDQFVREEIEMAEAKKKADKEEKKRLAKLAKEAEAEEKAKAAAKAEKAAKKK